jgi:hypothetical protein
MKINQPLVDAVGAARDLLTAKGLMDTDEGSARSRGQRGRDGPGLPGSMRLSSALSVFCGR